MGEDEDVGELLFVRAALNAAKSIVSTSAAAIVGEERKVRPLLRAAEDTISASLRLSF